MSDVELIVHFAVKDYFSSDDYNMILKTVFTFSHLYNCLFLNPFHLSAFEDTDPRVLRSMIGDFDLFMYSTFGLEVQFTFDDNELIDKVRLELVRVEE